MRTASVDQSRLPLIFDINKLTGSIPDTLGYVQTLEAICFNWNSLNGPVPSNLNNLTSVRELYLSNNNLNGPLPNLTGMNFLNSLVEQLEREVAELRHALADKQEQENVMLQVLMRVEQEQRVTEDAHRFAEQDAAAQRYAAQVLQIGF